MRTTFSKEAFEVVFKDNWKIISSGTLDIKNMDYTKYVL